MLFGAAMTVLIILVIFAVYMLPAIVA